MLAAGAKKRKLDQVKAKAVKGKVRTPSDRSYCCHFPLHLITDTSLSDLHPITNDCKPLCDHTNKDKKNVTSTSPDTKLAAKVVPEIDIHLWDGGESPFSVLYNEMEKIDRESITSFVQRLINDYPDEGDHLYGLSLLTRSNFSSVIIQNDEAIQRIVQMLPPTFFKMTMKDGYRADQTSLEDLQIISDQAAQKLNPADPGVYIRCYVSIVAKFRKRANEFLQGGAVANPNYKKLRSFLERWLVRNDKRSDDDVCCIPYIGETSRSVQDRFSQEDNPKTRDGANLQWEFFQWFGITIKFAMGYVAPGKGQSKFIEAFVAGIFQRSTVSTLGAESCKSFLLLSKDGTGLNQVRCGYNHFKQNSFLDWIIKKRDPNLGDIPLATGDTGFPKHAKGYIEKKMSQILAYVNDMKGTFVKNWPNFGKTNGETTDEDVHHFFTPDQLHSFVSHTAAKRENWSKKEWDEVSSRISDGKAIGCGNMNEIESWICPKNHKQDFRRPIDITPRRQRVTCKLCAKKQKGKSYILSKSKNPAVLHWTSTKLNENAKKRNAEMRRQYQDAERDKVSNDNDDDSVSISSSQNELEMCINNQLAKGPDESVDTEDISSVSNENNFVIRNGEFAYDSDGL